jgi:hypothetical protein
MSTPEGAAGGPDLSFAVTGVHVAPSAAVPSLAFALRVESEAVPIQSVLLRTQIRIHSFARTYTPDEQARGTEIFGRPEQWAETLKSLFWTNATTVVPGFAGSIEVELPVPVTYDLEVLGAKYLNALEGGDVQLEFLFSGTVFYLEAGSLRAEQISWEKDATFAMPAAVWHAAIEAHFPGTAWMRVDRELFDRLWRYRVERLLPTWDLALESLLDASTDVRVA